MKIFQFYLTVVFFVFGFLLITSCTQKEDPTASEEPPTSASGQSFQKLTFISVPGGDADALYAAVYDENGMPRDNVEIHLEPGVFALDPSQPFGGRLVLGEKSVLRSTLEMMLDATGIPMVDNNNEPIILVDGAKIDGSGLVPSPFGEGIIMVGDNGRVEKLWLAGGARPGVVVTFKGTVKEVASTGHSVGIQVRAAGQKAHAILERNLTASNFILGISILSLDPLLDHPTGANVKVRAEIRYSASINNSNVNLGAFGGVGATTDKEVHVDVFNSVFRSGAALGNIRIVGGQNIFAPGSNNNEVKVKLAGSLIADAAIGLKVEGGNLTPLGPAPLGERQSSDNQVKVDISNSTFENNTLDIRVEGSLSGTTEPGGDNNQAKVVIQDGDPATLTIETFNCFPEENWTGNSTICTSEATVEFVNED